MNAQRSLVDEIVVFVQAERNGIMPQMAASELAALGKRLPDMWMQATTQQWLDAIEHAVASGRLERLTCGDVRVPAAPKKVAITQPTLF